ncbi:hypothetical protein EVAR_5427_1 [Eumeta japonica]|uniref:FP protein C-terminal domain-containing protein n=1 Tax=Eumeta variegata TaxID=151549 RepID=A0A4C1TBQ1_EUMVA|nr:hypothetical protein EVAR_5427_1 [Eumeta japonica]
MQSAVETVDKSSRSLNPEIQCVPEKRTENLLEIFKKMYKEIPITDTGICSVFRIAKFNPQSARLRSILVTLPSEPHRDNIISAVRRGNKNQLSSLTSAHLGIHGDAINIHVSQHLPPPHTKKIHAAARKVSKERDCKYTWLRFGRVHIIKDDTLTTVLIKELKDKLVQP